MSQSSIKNRKNIRERLLILEEAGATLEEIVMGGKHPKIVVVYEGKRHSFLASVSNSDHHAMKNFRSQVRRQFNGRA